MRSAYAYSIIVPSKGRTPREHLEMPKPNTQQTTSESEHTKAKTALFALLREQIEISKLNDGELLLDILNNNWAACLAFMDKVETRFGCQVRSGADPGEYTVSNCLDDILATVSPNIAQQ
jgi:hypothetical protein